ncbi:ABC transporter substrate-binding protein [Ectothiorhodospiraceae bacterium WFHF3C12]|nr:ABC transporter substrate-binding protein [Ectothiorhodospiraceae bacterium WFHF3C12]
MAGAATAADTTGDGMTPPDALVEETTEQVLELLEERQAEIEQDPGIVFEIVREVVLPHFDFPLISRFVLGRHWREASPEQRERFMEEFRTLLIRTYGTSLAEYSGQEVEYLPMKADPESGRVVVRTEIQQAQGPAIPIAYRLHRTDEGWKVFDVIVEGASYVQTYRSEYGSLIASRGLDALIESLAEKNARKTQQGGGAS